MHARMGDGVLVTRATPTGGAWEDGQWVDFIDPDTLAAWEARHGWLPVVETPRPEDTETVKHDEAVVLVDGVPTQTWTARPWTQAELAAQAKEKAREAARVEREATRAKVKAIIADLASGEGPRPGRHRQDQRLDHRRRHQGRGEGSQAHRGRRHRPRTFRAGPVMPTLARRALDHAADRAVATRHARHRTDTTT